MINIAPASMNDDGGDKQLANQDVAAADAAERLALADKIYYSRHYCGGTHDAFQYRHVVVPHIVSSKLTIQSRLAESEWRALGLQMSPGWQHIGFYRGTKTLVFHRPNPKFISDVQ